MELLRQEPTLTVWSVGDEGSPRLGTLDPDILIWCERNQFLLVTNNRRSMPKHLADHIAQGRHVPGILTINLERSIPVIVADLILIAIATEADENRDTIRYLPL
jgi:hypothetical protein